MNSVNSTVETGNGEFVVAPNFIAVTYALLPTASNTAAKFKNERRALADVAWWIVLVCEPKGYRFDSQSGHMPGLQTRSSVGDT